MAKSKDVKKTMVLRVDVPHSQGFLMNGLWAAIFGGDDFEKMQELCEREDVEVEIYHARQKRSLVVVRTKQEDRDCFVFVYNPGSKKLTEKMYEALSEYFNGLGLIIRRL
jgi:hypothetical protein